MASVNLQQQFDLRFYDGTTPTPFFVPATFLDPPTLPLVEPRPETTVILGGNRATSTNIATIISDESAIFQPIPFSIRFALQSEAIGLIDAIGNMRKLGTWLVGGDTWTPQPLAALGTRVNSEGVSVNTPGPKDAVQINGLFRMVAKHSVPADAASGEPLVVNYNGCVVITAQVVVETPQVYVAVDGAIYGGIDPTLTDFPTGTQSTLP